MADTVLYEVTDRLATVTLNRPEAMNALNVAMKEALRDSLRRAASDSGVRAVLLTGNGRAFCVGQDLKEHIGALDEEGDPLRTVGLHYNPIVDAITGMRKPVVAAVNGVAAGAGFGFALAADYRVVAESASFSTAFAGIALTADSGLSWTLPRAIGPGRAADLLLFPRKVAAAEAERLGIAQRVVPDTELPGAAREVALRLAQGPTLAYAAIKESLAFAAGHPLAETLEVEARLQSQVGASADHRAAVAAFVRKERPTFRGE
ncbi:enoyl-CoA hydratase/isomerase family protein [Streptomyces sp. NBC_01803]|uniref:enoyl-CoA hydratase/isomerase family protein n=1 Tax=Streptomyces sp. NBC_01803 TaxID=2975946 RepID=UPI002DDC45B7|nr:enoyl-CoA hydratase-related protein [Streptomyces sp. NBC_01803]WSA46017.1 enoyl-CoA hydratase-related protein [Streptomyces sp. NBC_01803]